jgi:nucleotide-binding universal stress UspA family protein
MSYKAILVFVDMTPESEARVEAAVDLARRFEAVLIGVSAGAPRVVIDPYGTTVAPALAAEREQIEADLKSAEKNFTEKAAGVKNEWRAAVDYPTDMIMGAAAAADLIVLGRREAGAAGDAYYSPAAGEVLMGAGRPVLVVPHRTPALNLHDIVVGWKDTREARRAVTDALPFLKRADNVMVLSFRESADEDPGLDNVAAFLKRHGVTFTTESTVIGHSRVEEEIYRFASVAGSGLIVAGAYGHTRLREWMFGGVTYSLLNDSAIPVLLSH